ncbi:hypothetical protein CYY_000963 [Polysphondylium violaceum]|uniref:Cyclin-like domain-containing protein n=1 Tax=Polysphondylium violaceum TaxID=133409 RepID=A0A8J4UWN6_9MYCE|nr:hypothetical protein CYY_000963 [Polysphondylium violaceum]
MNLYFSDDEILNSPSRRDGVSEQVEDNQRRYGAEILQEAGILLELPQSTIVTSQIIFQRFFSRQSFRQFDVKTIALGCLFVSCKFTNSLRKIRDLLNTFTHIWQKRENLPVEYIDTTKQHYWDLKGDVIAAEFEILREFGFMVSVDYPHKYILNYMKLLDKSTELAQKSWNYLNDSMRTTVAIQYRPEAIAAASIFLASRVLAEKLPEEPYPWWELFDTTRSEIDLISYEINNLYSKPKPFYIKFNNDDAVQQS